jgi:hypothetical protein
LIPADDLKTLVAQPPRYGAAHSTKTDNPDFHSNTPADYSWLCWHTAMATDL